MNRLTLKALLLDTLVVLTTGKHMHKNYKIARNKLCCLLGQPRNICNKQLLTGIGLVYQDNGVEGEFWKLVHQYKAIDFVNAE